MLKATVKKLLRSMSKEDIIEMVIEMYDARKEAKEYLEYYANPDENGKLEEYKDIILLSFILRDVAYPRLVYRYAEKLLLILRNSSHLPMLLQN